VSRKAPQRGEAAHAEREAFDRALAPIYAELLQAAQREVRYRVTLGQFAPDNPTPEQLLDMALQRAWRHRRHRSPRRVSRLWRWPRFSAPEKCWLRARNSAIKR
jgi:hypothetical protein